MHCLARRAGYPSVSSRAARQQPRTRPACGGPPHYVYAVVQLRHLRHRPRPGGADRVPARCRPGRETTATAPGRRCGPGRGAPPSPSLGCRSGPVAVPRPGLRIPGGEPASATVPGRRWPAASRGRCRPGRRPGGAPWATETPRVADSRASLGPSGERIALGRVPVARTHAVGQGRGRVASMRPPRTPYTVPHVRLSESMLGHHGGPDRRTGSPPQGRRLVPGRKRWGRCRGRYRLG
jgi:hypothetical protein